MPDTVASMTGHNNPPDLIEGLIDTLRMTHADSINRSAELAGMAERLPASCDDDDTAARRGPSVCGAGDHGYRPPVTAAVRSRPHGSDSGAGGIG